MADPARRPILRGEHIVLRPAEHDDVATFVGWMNDADFVETLGGRGPISTIAEERWFEELQGEQGKTRWHFVVCLRDDGRPIGIAGLESVDLVNGQAELGIGIGDRSMWDKGYGTEATGAILDFGFGELRLHRVLLHFIEGNERARHLYQKVGFVHEGTLRQAQFRHGRYLDVHLMGILREEWLSQERPPTWEID
jgi:RimJ/RimL family protein N-acetyltransferase